MTSTSKLTHAWLLPAVLALTAACSHESAPPAVPQQPSPASSAQTEWPQFVSQFVEDFLKARPSFAIVVGRHEFDGKTEDWSAAGIASEIAMLKHERSAAQAFDAAALTPTQQFERDYLLSVLDEQLFWLETDRAPFTNPLWYIDQLGPEVYLSGNYEPVEKRLVAYIDYAKAIPRIAAAVRANLTPKLPKVLIERGISGFGGYAKFYRHDVPKAFAAVRDAQLLKEFAAVNEAAAREMDGLKAWLESKKSSASDEFAMGLPLFTTLLSATDHVSLPLSQIVAAGREDLQRNTQALKEACALFLPKGTLRACVEKMSADKPTGGALEGARAQLQQLKDFIIAHHVVTFPQNGTVEVAEAPPYNRENFAYLNLAGFYEKNSVSTYNISPPDPSWSAKERADYIPGKAYLLYITVHEVWPGHYLQFQHAYHDASRLAPLFVGYAFAEGWAHYCEEMMWEEGLGDGDPEQHVGQIANALVRDVRLLTAVGLHTQGMTIQQAEALYRDAAFADAATARQQAARGAYDPSYLNYTLGKLMIRKLRADWVAKQVGANTSVDPRKYWQAFHDQFLSYGGPPIPMIRKAMLGDVGELL